MAALTVACLAWHAARGENFAVQLDGNSGYVELPAAIWSGMVETTVEGWVWCENLRADRPIFDFGKAGSDFEVGTGAHGADLAFRINAGGRSESISVPNVLRPRTWFHVAAVAGRGVMELFLNGVRVGSQPLPGGFAASGSDLRNWVGRDVWAGMDYWEGRIDDIRVWGVARTEAEVRQSMFQRLPETEAGLLGAWSFDSTTSGGSAGTSQPAELRGQARLVASEGPTPANLVRPAVLHGRVYDGAGQPATSGFVRVEEHGVPVAQTPLDADGEYLLVFLPRAEHYDILASTGRGGDWRLNLAVSEGECRQMDFTARPDGLSGAVLTLDGSPQGRAVVQLVQPSEAGTSERTRSSPPLEWDGPRAIAATVTDTAGQFELRHVKPGRYQLRVHGGNGFTYFHQGDLFEVRPGQRLTGVEIRLAPLHKGIWGGKGVVDTPVLSVFTAADGALWFGTMDGVVRYDGSGQRLELSADDGLLDNHVWSLVQDWEGRMWFGTSQGVSRYDSDPLGASPATFATFTSTNGLPFREVRASYAAGDGTLWFGGRFAIAGASPLACYRNGQMHSYAVADTCRFDWVAGIAGSRDHLLWLATDQGLVRFDGNRFVNVTTGCARDALALTAVAAAPDGAIWFASPQALWRYRPALPGPEQGKLTRFGAAEGMLATRINALEFDRDGALWLGTEEDGALRLRGDSFVMFPQGKKGLEGRISAICCDRQGMLWFATDSGALCYDEDSITTFTEQDGLPNRAGSAICLASDGSLWYGSRNHGLACGEAGGLERGSGMSSLLGGYGITGIKEDVHGGIWVTAGSGGVFHGRGATLTNFGVAHQIHGVLSVDCEPDGTVWFGGLDSVWCLTNGAVFNLGKQDGLKIYRVLDIRRAADGAMWFAGRNGVVRFDGRTTQRFTTAEGLAANDAQALYCDPAGPVWVGTGGGGLSRYDGRQFVAIPASRKQLANGDVRCIYRDRAGILWFGTARGVSLFDGVAWASLDSRDGLPAGGVQAICQGPDDALWFVTNDGLVRYRKRTTAVPPPPEVTVRTDQGQSNSPAGLRVTAGTPLTVAFHAVDLSTRPEARQYRFRVERDPGSSTRREWRQPWSAPVTGQEFKWTTNRPGTYTVAVQYIDRDLSYSRPALASLSVVPPWYLDRWTVGPIGGGAFVLLGLAMALRFCQARSRLEAERLRCELADEERARWDGQRFASMLIASQEQERKRLARELHDSLGQHLCLIRNTALIGAQTLPREAAEKLQEIAALAGEATNEVRQIALGLRPEELDRLGLRRAMVALISKASASGDTEFTHDIDEIDHHLAPEHEINLYRVVQEGVNNILKHARAPSAHVAVKKEENTIRVRIEDNGAGCGPKEPGAKVSSGLGFGLSSMSERVRILGGKLSLSSSPGRGTVVEAVIPIAYLFVPSHPDPQTNR